jgi:hypothetical protein
MKTRLTDRLIGSLKPPATGRLIRHDTVVSGLSFRINAVSTKNPDGLRYWFFATGRGGSRSARLF